MGENARRYLVGLGRTVVVFGVLLFFGLSLTAVYWLPRTSREVQEVFAAVVLTAGFVFWFAVVPWYLGRRHG